MTAGRSMSEQAANDSQGVSAEAEQPTQPPAAGSAGALLRQAREAAGVDIATLAQALKVSVKKLEALEQDRYEQLPDAVFARALASSVCRSLRIDPAPVLACLPQVAAPRLSHDDAGLNTPFHTPADLAQVPFWDRLSRPMVLAALAVLLGALVIILFPSREQRAEIGAIVSQATALPPAASVPAVAVVAVPPPLPPASATPPDSPPATATAMAAPTAAAAPPMSPAAPVQGQVRAAGDAAQTETDAAGRRKLAATGLVVFKTREPSWIEVVDAQGTVQISRVLEPGEPAGVTGTPPLSVVIGRAEVTEVQVRGKPYDLAPVTRQGVARFEVK